MNMKSAQIRTGRSSTRAARLLRDVAALRPGNEDELHRFVRVVLGMDVPRVPIVTGHTAPFEYLAHAFFEREPGDCVVWACRGGGKTRLGAAATVLDLLFKPGIRVRILGGSFEQSTRMYEHLRQMLEQPMLRALIAGEPTHRAVSLVNASGVALLSQSQRSVRGTRVHKLRCDEVEEFDDEVWSAAQMVTRSGVCGGVDVRGSVEAISTMHRPFGLMNRLVTRAGHGESRIAAQDTHDSKTRCAWHPDDVINGNGDAHSSLPLKLFRWSAMDVIARCPADRPCEPCPLWTDCRGRAKQADGFVAIDDLVRQRLRTSDASWASEMMCAKPRTEASVYAGFESARHVAPGLAALARREWGLVADEEKAALSRKREGELIAGMDFGMRSPLVMLWARVVEKDGEPGPASMNDRVIEVLDEYAEQGLTLEAHLERIEGRGWPMVRWIGVDPAGQQRNAHSGLSDVEVLRRRGWRVRAVRLPIASGIDRVQRRLDRGLLRIDAGCTALIRALREYHFDPADPQRVAPVKDGPDHLCDALRYMVTSLEATSGTVRVKRYG